MLNAKGLIIVLPFALAICALIYAGVKEYKRIANEQQERDGLDPAGRDHRAGYSAFELAKINGQLIRSDRTRGYMKQLADSKRGGYQRRYKVEG